MKIFIDTTQKYFVACLFNQNFKVNHYIIKLTKYKVEEIINFFSLIEKYLNEIKDIYINIGPGSFTGSRIALLYVRTLSQIKKINIYTSDTFTLIKKTKRFFLFKKTLCIPATKNKSYCQKYNENQIQIINVVKNNLEINYKKLIFNFYKYLNCFSLSKLESLKPIYASEPQIGK